ncbi:unnamed protein product (macronuclear) [Paramecium tetraurelia]|uniref:Response regulatory domain-containing protein n=1 Tax=Paramecium tetraurelia TaxID=5888 RepID=A0DVG7_PARTE|nr:uncharacterized protein GSPATT00020687001 [Paramecium tetraurelia]CAK87034.1 unnamed protein product [Paramecium tetraurelia]|eukprot:XP_001454431.1 hypothetical protein (macronuclear) [Paramecium tetraurelia strain d4-2]
MQYSTSNQPQQQKQNNKSIKHQIIFLQLSLKETGLTLLCCNTNLSVDDEVFNQISLQLLLVQQGMNVDIVQILLCQDRYLMADKQSRKFKILQNVAQNVWVIGYLWIKKLREMMQNQQLPKIPIIGLTAFTSDEEVEKYKEVGMLQILHKPLDIQKLSDFQQCQL